MLTPERIIEIAKRENIRLGKGLGKVLTEEACIRFALAIERECEETVMRSYVGYLQEAIRAGNPRLYTWETWRKQMNDPLLAESGLRLADRVAVTAAMHSYVGYMQEAIQRSGNHYTWDEWLHDVSDPELAACRARFTSQ